MMCIPQPTFWRPRIWSPARRFVSREITPAEHMLRGLSNWFMATKGKGQVRPDGKGCKSLAGKGNANGATDNICGCIDTAGTHCASRCPDGGPATIAVVATGIAMKTPCAASTALKVTGNLDFEGDATESITECVWVFTKTLPGALLTKYSTVGCTGSIIYSEIPLLLVQIQRVEPPFAARGWYIQAILQRNDSHFDDVVEIFDGVYAADDCTLSGTMTNSANYAGTGGTVYFEP